MLLHLLPTYYMEDWERLHPDPGEFLSHNGMNRSKPYYIIYNTHNTSTRGVPEREGLAKS